MALRAAAARLASSSLRRRHSHLLPAALLSPAATTGPTAFLHSHATSFGYKQVREDEKSKLVGNVFSSVASSYDVMNDLMSVGLHRLWKDRLISKLNPFPGMKHLDVAGGTGDVAFRVVERIKSVSHRATQGTLTDLEEDTHIYVCDINPNMLDVGKKRAAEKGYNEEHCLSWVQGDAEALSFEDGSMDGYTIAFGIRNVTHIEKALSEAYRVLKKGGRFLCLELSHVDVPVFKDMSVLFSQVCCHCTIILYENCLEHYDTNKQVNSRAIINYYQQLHCSFQHLRSALQQHYLLLAIYSLRLCISVHLAFFLGQTFSNLANFIEKSTSDWK